MDTVASFHLIGIAPLFLTARESSSFLSRAEKDSIWGITPHVLNEATVLVMDQDTMLAYFRSKNRHPLPCIQQNALSFPVTFYTYAASWRTAASIPSKISAYVS